MRSPDHRRAVLAPSITLAGIGVAVIEADGGARIVVTELFASER